MLWGRGSSTRSPCQSGPCCGPQAARALLSNRPQHGAVTARSGVRVPSVGSLSVHLFMSETAGFVTPPVPAGLAPRSCVNEAPGPCPEPVVLQAGPSWGRAQLCPASLSSAGQLAGVPFSGVDATPSPALMTVRKPKAMGTPCTAHHASAF